MANHMALSILICYVWYKLSLETYMHYVYTICYFYSDFIFILILFLILKFCDIDMRRYIERKDKFDEVDELQSLQRKTGAQKVAAF